MVMLLHALNGHAVIEQYVKYLNEPFVANHSVFTNQDIAFQNPSYTWSTINNLSVQDAVTLQVIDSLAINSAFSYTVTLKIKYYTNPDTVAAPPVTTTQSLTVNYVPGQGGVYKGIAAYNFTGAYKIVVTITGTDTHGTPHPSLTVRLSSSIVIDRKYQFQGSHTIAPAYTFAHSNAQLNAAWAAITGAEEYDLEWTTINDGNNDFAIIDNRYKNPGNTDNAAVTAALTRVFRNNGSRVTTPKNNYTLSLLSTDTYVVLRIRQVQYLTNGVRQMGNWDYTQSGGHFAIFLLNWHQPYLNWQYSAAYAEDGKKKEVVSYFDGSLRGRQTVTLNNTDNIALAQENIYDAFGRPIASILPAPFVDSSGTAYLHYNVNFNKNASGGAYNFNNLGTLGSYCEWLPDSLSTVSGASKYYSSRNAFYNHGAITGKKLYNSFIPTADHYPLSVTQYTADNTGRIQVQGGVGPTFQPGKTSSEGFSRTTKYYYGKPEQYELDALFGNDVGYAEHYLKNMVVDPNGQVSVSYVNASGKTVATALTGHAPSNMDTLASYSSVTKTASLHVLKPEQFVYNNADMKLTASTTYLNAVIDTGRLAFSIQKLVDKFPGGADSICSNCFYQMSVNVTDDCGDIVASTTTPVHIGKSVSNCADTGLYTSSLPINFQQIGAYYVNIEFALNKDTITYFTNNFITQGTANGYIQAEAAYIKQHYLDSLNVSGCYSDCTTCYTALSTQANFVAKVQHELIALELDSVAVRGTDFTNWMKNMYNNLIDSCVASQAHCYDPCQSTQSLMEQDVSPGGQYALFDSTGVATEPAINVIVPNWRTIFPILSPSNPVYQANQFTDTTGRVLSPNDMTFTLQQLIKYWQPGWAVKFLQYHPEYCKLQFCESMSSYESWDEQVQAIDQAANVNKIPGGSSLVYRSSNSSDWLLSTDPLFKTGAPGNSYLSQMRSDLLNYSKNVMNIQTDSLANKNLMQVIDYDLYCSNTTGNINIGSGDPWNNCTPNASCRVLDREWREYRDYYLALKQKYYTVMQNASCGLLCPVGQPLTYSPPGSAPSNNDFTLSPDTGQTAACAGQQSVVIQRSSTASRAAKTLTIYYPPVMDKPGLTHSVAFAANDMRKTFCVPDSIPVSAILIQNPTIIPPNYDTLSVVVTDKLSALVPINCNSHAFQKATHTTHVVLKNKNGQPQITTHGVNLTIDYIPTLDGVPQTTIRQPFSIPAGDSVATDYVYTALDVYSDDSNCHTVEQNIQCVEFVVGALLSTSGYHTQCTGYTDSIPAPPNCPAVYASKTSRFPTIPATGATKVSVAQAQSQSDSALTATKQQAGDICSGNIAILIDSLQTGLTAMHATAIQIDSLTSKMEQVCVAGSDFMHGSGVSDIIGDAGHGPTLYVSFAAAMKGVLGLSNFTPTLNPWLTPGPYPYKSQLQSTTKTISNSNSDICALLTTLTAKATAAGKTLYNYLTSTYGSAMTLSQSDLDTLQKSCSTCRFMLGYDITLPVFLDPGNIGCIKRTDYTTSVDTLMRVLFNHSLDTTKAKGQNIFTNYLNQRFGFALNYEDYSNYSRQLVTDTAATLCNELPYTTATIDSNSCLNNSLEIAVANGKAAYDNYIDSLKAAFRVSYINTCKLAQANATITAKQQTYHYTLYYYDQADNLVRTVPPEGVTLMDPGLFNYIDKSRDLDTAAYSYVYNGPTTASSLTTAMTTLSTTLSASAGAVEMWLYNSGNNYYHWVEVTPDKKYLFQVGLAGNVLAIDIFPTAAPAANTFQLLPATRHFSVNISSLQPLLPFTHVVLEGSSLGTGTATPQIYVNGKSLVVSTGPTPAPFGFTITGTATSVTLPDSIQSLKHLRLYNHTLTTAVITKDAASQFFNASDLTYLGWYRFNVPAVGAPPTTINSTTSNETAIYDIYPAHVLPTNYTYNSTNQVSQQLSPDGGTNSYWYDLLSRLTVSQNSKQLPLHNYSYTMYDAIGRITEVGQKLQTTLNIGTPHYLPADTIATFYTAGIDSQITRTYYDQPVPTVAGHTNGIAGVTQSNLRKRVAASTYQDLQAGPVLNATYYNYDIDGNVKTLWQQVNGLYIPSTNAGLKQVDYEYDLVSGKVNFVRYQDGQPDQFYYSYTYDADNRLTNAWSGTSAMVDTLLHSALLPGNGKRDAHYDYYLHGPLARMELGDTVDRVQGVDYAYTLQGWLKGVNSSIVQSSQDMGRDSVHVARDAYGYSLYYYGDGSTVFDYASISGTNPFASAPAGLSTYRAVYNGNIAAMSTNIQKLADPWHYYTYHYDQLNRVRLSSVYKNSGAISTRVSDYHESFNYDGNGNITSATRYAGAATNMDSLTYHYNTASGRLSNNRLNYIGDAIATHTWPYGLDNQASGNYRYDAIGNMTSDLRDTISKTNWTVYGKIMNLTNSAGTIAYSYNPAGQRVTKTANAVTTYYVRDAQGNTLALYDNKASQLNLREVDLYGSSRLGMWQPNIVVASSNALTTWDTVGRKDYELTNHLGNVWATITDKRLQHSSNGTTVDYFNADVATAQEYYAFGGLMPNRTYTFNSNYAYGFNGKRNDNDVKGTGNQIDYGRRMYDPRVSRFLSVDPLQIKYPELTPYQFASNSPIENVDLDGLESISQKLVITNGKPVLITISVGPVKRSFWDKVLYGFQDNNPLTYNISYKGKTYSFSDEGYAHYNLKERDNFVKTGNAGHLTSNEDFHQQLVHAILLNAAVANVRELTSNGDLIIPAFRSYNSATIDEPVQSAHNGAPESIGGTTTGVSSNVQVIPTNEISFSQSSVNDLSPIVSSMRENGWSGPAVNVVKLGENQYGTLDNTRVLAAHEAGIDVHANVHNADELLTPEEVRGFTTKKGVPKTWGDAYKLRIGKQNAPYRKANPNGSYSTNGNN